MSIKSRWPSGIEDRDEALRVYHSQHWFLYRQFDAAGTLLYVGETDCPERREMGHRSVSPWWPDVARTEYEVLPTYWDAKGAEVHAIRTEGPLYNVVHVIDRADRLAAKQRREARKLRAAQAAAPAPGVAFLRHLAGLGGAS